MKIALALSGGGTRGIVFNLGVLARLAVEERLEDVVLLSTEAGGSLCSGLIYMLNDYSWPKSDEFFTYVVPVVGKLLTTHDLTRDMIWRLLWPRSHHRKVRREHGICRPLTTPLREFADPDG